MNAPRADSLALRVAIPLVIVAAGAACCWWALTREPEFTAVPADALDIEAHGSADGWTFRVDGQASVQRDELTIPISRPIHLMVHADDRARGFFVREFRVVCRVERGVPGSLWLRATKLGSYDFFDTTEEGPRGKVHVVAPAEFESTKRR